MGEPVLLDAEWEWSSARAHAGVARANPMLSENRPFGGRRPHPLTGKPIRWEAWLMLGLEQGVEERLRRATKSGRPCRGEEFVARLERLLGRNLTPAKRGPKPRKKRTGKGS